MNYLAHAWTLERAAPGVVLGAALPDLMGAFDRRAPRLALDAARELEGRGEVELGLGVRAHHAADASFHALPAFKALCARLRGELAPLELERVRGFFAAHLLVEMLLDAALMEEDPALAPRFYEAIELAPRSAAARLCAGADAPGFEAWIERFVRARFVLDYAKDERLVHRVEQVLSRARQTLGAGGARRLEGALPRLREVVRREKDALTAEPRARVRALGQGE